MTARVRLMFDDFSRCESPIEALLQLAMAAFSARGRLEWCNADNVEGITECAHAVGWPCVVAAAQVSVDAVKARADFMLAQPRGRDVALLAVECDGAEWHHSNPDAVAKDRARDEAFSALGIVPVRLRGTWIALDPIESVRFCLAKLRDTQPPLRRPPPLTAADRALASRFDRRRSELGQAARALTQCSRLVSAVGEDHSMLAKREKLCSEVLGR